MNKSTALALGAPTAARRGAGKHRALLGLAALALTVGLAACSSGDGSNGTPVGSSANGQGAGVVDSDQPGGLAFSYPVDGQQDVYTRTQIALAFDEAVDSGSADDLTLVANPNTSQQRVVDTDVTQDDNQPGIFRLRVAGDDASGERPALAPNTRYDVQATGAIGSGNTRFGKGQRLFSFTTRPYDDGRPTDSGPFTVTRLSSIGSQNVPLTQFNPIRASFSAPVDESSVKLCTASQSVGDAQCTVAVTGPDGNVPGKLTVLGRYFTFDPTDDLAAGEQYTVAFGDGFQSAFGNDLSSDGFSVTPVSIGNDVEQNLIFDPTEDRPDNMLNGTKANVVNVVSQLIGQNNLLASNNPARGGLITRLAGTTSGSRYNDTVPAVIPAGQLFDITPINLKLNGTVDTPINTGTIHARLLNDADVYIVGSTLRNVEAPTEVLLRIDLGIYTDVGDASDPIKTLSNGVFNQTVMNIVAAGIAVPQDNGDLKLTTLGSFPAIVNRSGNAITDFELELTLKAGDQDQIAADQTPPRVIAQYPSACFYTFNTQAFGPGAQQSPVPGATPLSFPEASCIDVLSQRDLAPTNDEQAPDTTFDFPEPIASSLPLNASPSVTFSEPIDPTSLAGNITLTRNGNDDNDSTVPVRLQSEGASVVVAPVDRLQPDTRYTINVSNGVTDLAGNGLVGQFPDSDAVSAITFNTEPMVIPTGGNGQPTDISDNLSQRPAVRQIAPFLTVLTPGLPCALGTGDGSDFRSGGGSAGRCVGDSPTAADEFDQPGAIGSGDDATQFPAPVSARVIYPVFDEPANQAVNAYFSKPVRADTIALADGCLIAGNGDDANANNNATIAVQVMDGNGGCTGVVDGKLARLTPQKPVTEGFSFKPTDGFDPGQRYWIVVCGSADAAQNNAASQCSSGQTIRGQNGLALNTNPLQGTATGATSRSSTDDNCGSDVASSNSDDTPLGGTVICRDDNRGQGGPDIVMPFDGAPATKNYYTTTLALPKADTNGNGLFDNTVGTGENESPAPDTVIGGFNTGEDRGRTVPIFNDTLGRERAQRANVVFSRTLIGLPGGTSAGEAGFLGGGEPVVIRSLEQGESCSEGIQGVTFDDGTSVIGDSAPSSCVPVDLLPGGFTTITGLPVGYQFPTGQVLIRFPYRLDADGNPTATPQTGYIVPECQGSLQGQDYDYQPCFVVDLRLTINGPDTGPNLTIPQQDTRVHAFGPVAFEQNGRLVIAAQNANTFALDAFPSFAGGLAAPTPPGGQALQLVGQAVHGGRSFPVR